MNEKIVVLGGGTAGWMTALFIKHTIPTSNVTLIKSNEIGVIGVGEATTPHFIEFLGLLKIDFFHFLNKTGGTIKNGINFVNWNGDGRSYFHPFYESVVNFSIPNIFDRECNDYHLKNLIDKSLPFDENVYSNKISYANKIDLDRVKFACHFDSGLLSNYLEEIALSRGIVLEEGFYDNVSVDENGFIKEIILKDNRKFLCDFVFDCSGFSKAIIEKHFKEKWISYSNHLPMKKAIPFWLDKSPEMFPYTNSIAMNYGWMWQIPLQNRIGSGYVFDSDYIDENQALEEAEVFLGKKLEIRKIIDFRAGRHENFWVKNCMSVGLSSSFVEPLESTSLFVVILQFYLFKNFINEIRKPEEKSIKTFNFLMSRIMDDVLCFIYFHYYTKRNDTEFWKNLKNNYPIPEKLVSIIESIKNRNLRYHQFYGAPLTDTFPLQSYLHVGNGLGLFENGINNQNFELVKPSQLEYNSIINSLTKEAINHNDFLEILKEKYK